MNDPQVSVVATFPPGFFLENIVTLPDDSLLVTVANRKALYCVPPAANPGIPRFPILLEDFPDDAWPFGLTLAPHNTSLVYLLTTDFTSQGSCRHHIRVLDMSNVASACHCSLLAQFPPSAKGLNGLLALSDSVLLAADSFAGCIWRIDIELDGNGVPKCASITEWFRDPAFHGELVLPDFQPGVNGLKYSRATSSVCFSSTQQRLFGRIPVDPNSLKPSGSVIILHSGAQGDDLLIDDDFDTGPVAYLTTHRDNSIIKVPLSGDVTAESCRTIIQGNRESPLVLGPTAGAWKWRAEGKSAYITCDGGLKNLLANEPPRFARILQVNF